ncbi:amidohydrolase [Rhodococcoides trifolii]|uniref:Amidohydrolase n=1 Tax=Rhodococcoides trifolii TaxID=908250 RepID=A0A917CQG2_9NOCA|nr:amidohydrolase family protein [Rhodococcus trifolii]GGF96112.1 amidohydrolase [Rhodococcus trifolii]
MVEVSRRNAIRALATGGVVAGLGVRARTASAAPTGNYRIDLHSHFLPPRYRDALTASGYTAKSLAPVPSWSPAEALQFMDAHGIGTQVVSISDPGVGFLSGPAAVEMVRYTNDYAADLVEQHPTRFGAFAFLPLPDVVASLAELTHALDVRGLDGVVLLSSYNGIYLGDARFEPVMAALNARSAFVFVHPAELPPDNRPELPFPAFYEEYPFDTTRAAAILMASGTIDRYPNIRFSLAHAGGCLPFLSARLALPRSAVPAAPEVSVFATRGSIRKFFYDTSLSASAAAMRSVLEVTDIDNIVFGSDWPFSGLVYRADTTTDPAPGLSDVFDSDQRYRIERLNALDQLPSVAARIGR